MTLTALLPALTLAAGIVGTLLIEWIRDRLQRGRERAERAAERQQSRDDRREQFEIDTSREAFAALTRLARATAVFHLLEVQIARQHNALYGAHVTSGLPGIAEAEEEILLANREMYAAAMLLLDEDSRTKARAAAQALNAIGMPPPKSIDAAIREFDRSAGAVDAAHMAIAARIRELYAGTAIAE